MSSGLFTANLTTYSVQVVLLVFVAMVLAAVVRLRAPGHCLRYWQGVLLAILALPGLQAFNQGMAPRTGAASGEGSWSVVLAAASAVASSVAPRLPWRDVFLWVVVVGAVVMLLRMGIGVLALSRLRREAHPLHPLPPAVAAVVRQLGVRAAFRLTPRLPVPVSFGWRRATVLVPANFSTLDAATQAGVACHELLHVRRRDWLWMMCEEVVRALLWFHPAVWVLLDRIALYREQVIDREVVRMTGDRRAYLETLCAFAPISRRLIASPAMPLRNRSHLRERVVMLTKEVSMSRVRALFTMSLLTGLLLFTAVAAITMFPFAGPAWAADDQTPLQVGGDVLAPKRIVGPAPTYPDAAKEEKAEGVVVVRTVIDETGEITSMKVLHSDHEAFNAPVREALANWRFEPATRDGAAVAVWYNLTINFKLDTERENES